jgi:hypothetical protein
MSYAEFVKAVFELRGMPASEKGAAIAKLLVIAEINPAEVNDFRHAIYLLKLAACTICARERGLLNQTHLMLHGEVVEVRSFGRDGRFRLKGRNGAHHPVSLSPVTKV